MFCNYCRAPNPDDAVYCSACGQAVLHASEKRTQEQPVVHNATQIPSTQKKGDSSGKESQGTEESVASGAFLSGAAAPVTTDQPKASDLSSLNYQGMTEEELAQIQAAYAKVRVSPNAALLKELERRSRQQAATNRADVDARKTLSEPLSEAAGPSTPQAATTIPFAAAPESSAPGHDSGSSGNVATLETPLSLPVYGSLGHRFTAYFADLVVIYLIVIAAYFVSAIFQLPLSASEGESQAVTFVAIFVYMIIAQTAYHTTIGKYVHGLEVCSQRPDKRYPSFWRILLRETIGRVLSSLFLGAGYWLAIEKPKKQAWSDEIAGTVVTTRPTNKVLTRAFSAFVLVAFVLDVAIVGYGLYKEDRDKKYAALNKEIETVTEKIASLRDSVNTKWNRDEFPSNSSAFLQWQDQMKSVESEIDQYENQIDLMQGLLQRGISENLVLSDAERNQFVKLKQLCALRRRQAEKLRQEADLIINCDGTRASLTSLINDLQL